jgi:predicted DNA-binding WGR domain protein/BRCT domain type II-containing protein
MPLYEIDEGGTRKFSRIELDGASLELHWGRIGSAGTRKTKTFATVAEAKAAFEAEVQRRRDRGYSLVRDESLPKDLAAARSAAADDARTAELLAKGYALDAFGAAPSKKRRAVPKPAPVAPAPLEARPWPPPKGRRPLSGYTFAFFGDFAIWPNHHGTTPALLAHRLGATVRNTITEGLDCVVFGDERETGLAEAKRKAAALAPRGRLRVLDERAFRELVAVDLAGKRFAFAGELSIGLEGSALEKIVVATGAVVTTEIDDRLDYLVLGERRGPGKIAIKNQVEKRVAAGAPIRILDEEGFLELVRPETAPGAPIDFAQFFAQLPGLVDSAKLGRAMAMLREERNHIYSSLTDAHLVGIVRSQTKAGGVYASFLRADGGYGCATPDLSDCMGLQGTVCKHLLALVVGLARASEIAPGTALDWLRRARGRRPKRDDEVLAEAILRYQGAEAGSIDWRPTETIPEDFYAV